MRGRGERACELEELLGREVVMEHWMVKRKFVGLVEMRICLWMDRIGIGKKWLNSESRTKHKTYWKSTETQNDKTHGIGVACDYMTSFHILSLFFCSSYMNIYR